VSEDHGDLVVIEGVQKGIRQIHTPRRTHAGQHRIGLFGVLAELQVEDAGDGHACPAGQFLQPLGQARPFQRLGGIEQRQDQQREHFGQSDAEQHDAEPHPHAPPSAGIPHRSIEAPEHNSADDRAHEPGLHLEHQPGPQRLIAELEAVLDHEAAVVVQRQTHEDTAPQHHDRRNQEPQPSRSAGQAKPPDHVTSDQAPDDPIDQRDRQIRQMDATIDAIVRFDLRRGAIGNWRWRRFRQLLR